MSSDDSNTNVRRCHATILFADVCSSTQLAEICDPESLAEILYQVRITAERVVDDHHGVINQFYGDGVLAAFGFPTPHENDVLNATEAALALNQAIASLPLKKYLPKSFKLRLHTGVHAGLMVVQDGDRLQGQYKLYGDALNTAARLADAADEGEVFASESTLRGVLPYFEVEKLEPLVLKGKGASLPAYRVLRRTEVKTRFEASIRKGLAPFVGRANELGELKQRLQQSQFGHLQVVKVIGDAGLGKTRLLEEFLSSVADNTKVYRAYCDRESSAVPLQPFIQILRRCFMVERNVLPESAIQSITEHLKDLGEEVSGYTATYLKLLSLSAEEASEQVQPGQIAGSIVALMREIAKQQPLILFIDDWHWADDLSRQVMGELIRGADGLPIQVLLATRKDDLADRSLGGTSFRIDPFDVTESRRAVASLFAASAVEAGIVDSIFERSGGNALFIEELCQSLLAEGNTPNLESSALLEVPATLHGLIESRIERLPPEQLELIRTAAVIGNIVPTGLFERVLGYRLPQNLIIELSHLDLLYLTEHKDQLRFKHGITRDVIFQSVTLKERQKIHRRVAQVLQQEMEELGGDEHYEALAYHFAGAGEDVLAIRYAELAGDKAVAAKAMDRARAQYQSALEVMDELDSPDDSYEHWNAIAQRLGWACVFDPLPQQIDILQRAVELAEQHGDLKAKAKAEYWLGYINYSLGRSREAVHHCEQSLAAAREYGEKGLEIHALTTLAQSWATQADYQKALAGFEQAIALRGQHQKGGLRSVGSAYALACRAFVFADFGDFEQAQQQLDLAYSAVAGADAEMEGSIYAVHTAAYLWQGRWEQALDASIKAQEHARKITSAYVLGMGAALGAYAKWRINGDRAHIEEIIEASDWLESKGKRLFGSLNYGYLADALMEVGDEQGVRHYTARALMRVRQGDRLGESIALRAMAKLAVKNGDSETANHYLDRALASAQARNSRHEHASITLSRAECLLAEDSSKSRELIGQACKGFDAMEMPWHLQRAEQLLAGL